MMPRDVATRWNSTGDMLDFAVVYKAAIRTITSDGDYDLVQYQLTQHEWQMVDELSHALSVCIPLF